RSRLLPGRSSSSTGCLSVEVTSGFTPRRSEKKETSLVSTRISSESSVEMGDYLSVIRRRKLLMSAMTLAGLALALFYSVAVATPSYVSHAKLLVSPITTEVTPQIVDKLVVMDTEREIATSVNVANIAKDRMKSTASVT